MQFWLRRSKLGEPLLVALDVGGGHAPLDLGKGLLEVAHGDRVLWDLVLGHVLDLVPRLSGNFSPHSVQRRISADVREVVPAVPFCSTCHFIDVYIRSYLRWWSNDWNGYRALYLRTIFSNTTELTKYSEEERKGMKNIGTRKHSKIPIERNVRQRRTLNGRLQV